MQGVIEVTTAIAKRGQGVRVGFQCRGGPFGLTASEVDLTVGDLDAEWFSPRRSAIVALNPARVVLLAAVLAWAVMRPFGWPEAVVAVPAAAIWLVFGRFRLPMRAPIRHGGMAAPGKTRFASQRGAGDEGPPRGAAAQWVRRATALHDELRPGLRGSC